ncbi:efflux RND transporter periplasmic adaptor subunit [Burkholderia gladioli]|uniref:efflux RND transporter periplasmic adaptor subunit n=1 Tax=Burkholderia gladioli TaxID=28095 RepID=UPI0016404632|nr:efflux RND transporter periplasmic adaptor subunit [Burkholderia gladioli]MBJ9675925.1 efflux RND transporter periplasmic adaptor subunit [Burkholderia gladioli]MDN7462138.1 efflux RND transporter periplasmic adaptor subunit [Burkholderia gladioli]
MTIRSLSLRAALALIAGAALLGAGYLAGSRHRGGGDSMAAAAVPSAGGAPAPRKVLYWHDPMVPNQHFDKPGKSPFMDMQLQPVYADGDDGAPGAQPGIRIDAGLQQDLGIRYAKVRRRETSDGIDAIGTTQFDESRAEVVQSRVTGYIDRLYANAPQQRIAKGAPVASLFVPDWLAPQEEYLALRRGSGSPADAALLDAARARMRALSIPDALVAAAERSGSAQTHLTLAAPDSGVVSELDLREGAMVAPGQTIAKINGLSTLWLLVEIPEALALRVRPGMAVDATPAADPSRHIQGRLREILPGIDTGSRTLQARVELDNRSLALTPGMLMRVRVDGGATRSRLVVPSEAVIVTGKRSVVIVRDADGKLRPATVSVGRDLGDFTEVLDGLGEGETVVASGQFLIDSEASLKSVLPRLEHDAASREAGGEARNGPGATDASSRAATSSMSSMPASPASAADAAGLYETTGRIEHIDAQAITLSHQPVPALGWPAMTMTFEKPSPGAFADAKVGQTVRFAFRHAGEGYRLSAVEPSGGPQ